MFIKNKKDKGITLIALVVTIIVLLILAGVSIAMLTGEGGILTNAKDAASETKKGTAKESIDLEILDSITDSGVLNIGKLNENLKSHISGLTHNGKSLEDNPITELPTNVELDGFVFEIDEYGKTKEVNGILLSKNSLELQIEVSGEERTYGEETLTATLAGISGDIEWTTEGEGDAVQVDELEDGKSVKVKAKQKGEATITATCSGKTAECSVTVEEVQSPYIDNSYVQYDVEYTDVYTKTAYTKNTGWRAITDLTDFEDEGEYQGNIDIISTGIPAELYYYPDDISSAPWAAQDENQRNKFVKDYYGTTDNVNVYAAAGLLYNFKQIMFNYKGKDLSYSTIAQNKGGFVNIVTNGKEATGGVETTGDSLFTAKIASGTIDGIRSVNLKDLTGKSSDDKSLKDTKKGLFKLYEYTPDKHSRFSDYTWLASPGPTFAPNNLLVVDADGSFTDGYNGALGLRPVVTITEVNMKLNGHVWEIIE